MYVFETVYCFCAVAVATLKHIYVYNIFLPLRNNCGETVEIKMKETIKFMYFWLNYSDKINHFKRTPVAVENIKHLSVWPVNYLNELHLFLLSGVTRIDDNEYLETA